MSESMELAEISETRAVAQRSGSDNIIAAILEAARDSTIDAGKVETMANLAMKMQDRELAAQFNRDFNAALQEMPVITRAGIITIPGKDGAPGRTQGRFARFEDIDRVIRPILRRHNLAIRFEVGEVAQNVSVRPIISHANGHTERGEAMKVPLDTSGSKNNTQGAGSSVTYGKRYSMCAFLNIVTEGTDDDGSLGKFEIGMPHERELIVLEQAEEAATDGTYADWFKKQSPKDRGWLVDSGHHTRLGGSADAPGAMLIGHRPAADPPRDQARDLRREVAADTNTPEGWTKKYEADCAAAPDLETLIRVQTKGTKGIEKLKANDETLYNRAVKAGSDAAARLAGGEG